MGNYRGTDELSFFLQGQPANTLAETPGGRLLATSDLAALTSGQALAVAVLLQQGDVVNNISFVTGATAAVTPTHWFTALYDTAATPNLLQQSADQLTNALAANTVFTQALAAAVKIAVTGFYWAVVMVAAGTVPSLRGRSTGAAVLASAPIAGMALQAQTFGAGLTAAAPAQITGGAASANVPYLILN